MAVAQSDAALVKAAIDKFAPDVKKTIASVRAALRKRFPSAYELVYDNYNFFVIGYAPSNKPSHTIVTLVADAHHVVISFYRGADVADPKGLLHGEGKQNRFLHLPDGAETLAQPAVRALIDDAEARAPEPMPKTGKIVTIMRSVSAKQRPRRLV